MKITLSGFEFNRIMRTCVPAISRDETRQALAHIEVRCKGGVGVATASDSYSLAQCCFEYEGDDGVFLLRSHRTVKNDSDITIEVKKSKISISDGTEVVTRKACESEHPDWGKIVVGCQKEKQRASIAINPDRLRRILESFSKRDGIVTLEIRGEHDAVVIRSDETYAMVLPLKLDGKHEFAHFTRPELEAVQEGERNA